MSESLYPGELDTFPADGPGAKPPVKRLENALRKVEAKVGKDGSTVPTSVDFKLAGLRTDVDTKAADDAVLKLIGSQTRTGTLTLVPDSPSAAALIVKGAAGQTANIQEWQTPAGLVQTRINGQGHLVVAPGAVAYVSTDSSFTAALNVQPPATGWHGIVIRGLVAQTADLQQWQNSAGLAVSRITAGGDLYIAALRGADAQFYIDRLESAMVSIGTGAGGNPGLIVRGVAAQAAPLQKWQNSAGADLVSILSNGNLGLGVSNPSEKFSAVRADEGVIAGFGANGAPNLFTIGYEFGILALTSSQYGPLRVRTLNNDQPIQLSPSGGNVGIAAFSPQSLLCIGTDGVSDGNLVVQASAPAGTQRHFAVNKGAEYGVVFGYMNNADSRVGGIVRVVNAEDLFLETTNGAIQLALRAAGTLDMNAVKLKWSDAGNVQTTVGAAGGASILPATPTKYLKVVDNAGTTLVVPAYAAA